MEVVFDTGEKCTIDLSEFVSTGEVTVNLRDEEYFGLALTVLDDGDGIGWPAVDVEIDADALWYKAHPEDWARDYGEAAFART